MKSISKIRKIAAVAAILVLALTLASCGANKPAGGDTNTDGVSTTEKTPDDPAPEFEIEDGVLVSYRGSDEIVTVPDDVTEIAAGAFEASPNVKGITTVKIGANVKKIADTAFSRTVKLAHFAVADGNENFVMLEDSEHESILANKDMSQFFAATERVGSQSFCIDSVAYKIQNGLPELGMDGFLNHLDARYIIGGAVIEVEIIGNLEDSGSYWYFDVIAKKISFLGNEIAFPKDRNIGDCRYFSLAVNDEYFAISFYDSDSQTYIIGRDGVADILEPDGPLEEACAYSCYYFYLVDDGSLGYERMPQKFFRNMTICDVFEYCVARDEFWREIGTVSMNGSKPVFTVSEIITVEDEYEDLDEVFKGCMPAEITGMGLDTFLAENAKKYARAY